MPSVKLAKKAAALAVVKELHKAEELNDHLKQVEHKEEDSDEEDCNKMEMKKVMRAGTKRRVQYYLKQVQCFSLTIFHIPPSLSLHAAGSQVFSELPSQGWTGTSQLPLCL